MTQNNIETLFVNYHRFKSYLNLGLTDYAIYVEMTLNLIHNIFNLKINIIKKYVS